MGYGTEDTDLAGGYPVTDWMLNRSISKTLVW